MRKNKKWKYTGVRRTTSGNWEVSYYPFKGAKKKHYETLPSSLTEKQAKDKRDELIVGARQKDQMPEEQRNLLSADFSQARQDLMAGMFHPKLNYALPVKTVQGYEHTYDRMYIDFRALKYPTLTGFSQLTPRLGLRFFEQYHNYYSGKKVNEADIYHLGKINGWRAELIRAKAILKRLYRVGHVSAELIVAIKEQIHRPQQSKTPYYELSDALMKQILDGIKEKRPDFWDLARFQNATGRRVEECTLIEKADVKWQDGLTLEKLSIRSETTKMKEEAPIWILADLGPIVKHAYANSSQHPRAPQLFLNRTNRKINQRDYNECLGEVSEEVTGVRITTKYFRKRFMTECQKRGVSLPDAMAVCGLKDKEVALQYYSYSTKEGQKRALEAMRLT